MTINHETRYHSLHGRKVTANGMQGTLIDIDTKGGLALIEFPDGRLLTQHLMSIEIAPYNWKIDVLKMFGGAIFLLAVAFLIIGGVNMMYWIKYGY